MALEAVAKSRHSRACKDSESSGSVLLKSLESSANAIISEAISRTSSEESDSELIKSIADTVGRLSRLMIAFSGIEEGPKLQRFVEILSQLSYQTANEQNTGTIQSIVQDMERHQESLGLSLCSSA